MATSYSGVRISPKDVVRAYSHLSKVSKGRTKARRATYATGTTKCGLPRGACALSALILSTNRVGKSLKTRTEYVREEAGSPTFFKVLSLTPAYGEGFMGGFDSSDFGSFEDSFG